MKVQSSSFKVQNLGAIFLLLFLLVTVCFSLVAAADKKWQGIDESVVEKIAKEHGREAMKPIINTDQGDLLLFVFLVAGSAGGFIAGYYWRILITGKESRVSKEEQKT